MYEEDYTELHGLDYDSSNIVNKSVNRWIPTSSEEGSITGDIITYISCEAKGFSAGRSLGAEPRSGATDGMEAFP